MIVSATIMLSLLIAGRARCFDYHSESVSINQDGTLNWHGESGHPTDSEIDAKMSAAQSAFDTQASEREDENGALGATDE